MINFFNFGKVAKLKEENIALWKRLLDFEFDDPHLKHKVKLIEENKRLKSENKQLRLILKRAEEKIDCYGKKYGYEYVGGMSLVILMAEIKRILKEV